MVIAVAEPYFQCARVIVRSRLLDGANPVDPATLPTPGAILTEMSGDCVDGPAYDAIRYERALASLW